MIVSRSAGAAGRSISGERDDRFVALQAQEIVERLTAGDDGRLAALPPELRGAPKRDVVGALRDAVGARVVEHEQIAGRGAAERPGLEQFLVISREHVAALAERARDRERLRLTRCALPDDRD